ncbi:MAG: hypothetical protein QXX57_05470 [Nitrososphaerota archaeon]
MAQSYQSRCEVVFASSSLDKLGVVSMSVSALQDSWPLTAFDVLRDVAEGS